MPRKGPGRPTKLTEEVHETIVQLVRAGNYLKTAAELAMVPERTMEDWIRRGRREREERLDTVFSRFYVSISRARAFSEATAVNVIREAAAKDWRAAQFFLTGRFADRWGQKATVRLELEEAVQEGERVLDISRIMDGAIPNAEDRQRFAAALLQAGGDDDDAGGPLDVDSVDGEVFDVGVEGMGEAGAGAG